MLKLRSAKTVSARKTFLVAVITVLIIAPFLPKTTQAVECFYFGTPINSSVKANGRLIQTETVNSDVSRAKGLSGRPCIKNGQAMLFVFNESDMTDHCFWMKDMRFSIDIVWLNADRRVVYRAVDVNPNTYPKSVCPGIPTRYVLETKANSSERLGLAVGTIVSF